MNKFKIHAIAAAIGLAFSIGAAAADMSKADYKSAKDGIAADYKSATAACASLSGNAKDICKAEAKGKKNVATAELEERRTPGDRNRQAVGTARAKADYAIAIEKCDDKAGADKKACVTDAKVAQSRAMNDAKPGTKPVAAMSKKEGTQDYVDDSVITAKVKTAVFEDPTLKSAEINVETNKGIVQLSGFVRSRTDINRAVQVARKVKGVTSVKNDMVVKGQQ
jgi:hyperosmotically inducible periplasmic protein